MTGVLDRLQSFRGVFRPRSIDEFFALQLARKLRDEAYLDRYLWLAEHQSREALLRAFARARKRQLRNMAEGFEEEIRKLNADS